MRPKIERYFLESFFLERNSWSSITTRELCSHQCLGSGFIFPELELLYKNVFTASFPKRSVQNVRCSFVSKKRTRSGSNVSSRLGKDQLLIHFTSLLDYLTPVAGLIFETKIESFFLESFFLERNYCPRTDFSGSNPGSILSHPVNS